MALSTVLLIVSSCAHHEEFEDENDEYDGPDKAAELAYRKMADPTTGKVDRQKIWEAILQTEQLKNQALQTPNSLSALTWTERGSYTDAVGPSNGNTRPGNGVTSGRMRAIWPDLSDATGKTVWVGGVDGGLWKTTDITAATPSWTLVNDFLSNLAISGICQDPTNTNTMYFCTGESFFNGDAVFGNGVFKSTDHGVTWNQLPSTTTLNRCSKILCDASGNVYVSTIGISVAVGLQRSSDGGNTWVSINPFSTTSRIVDFEISSTGTMHVSAGLSSGVGVGGYRYTTSPATATATTGWNSATTLFTFPTGNNSRTELTCAGNTVYAALATTTTSSSAITAIAKSVDGGANWTTTTLTTTNINDLNGSTTGGQGWYAIGLGVDPGNPNNVIVGSLNCLRSTDGGATFSKISEWVGTTGQYIHADQHNVTWYDNGNKCLVGCDGGIFISTNGGTNWSDRNTNLRLKQFYSVAIHPTSTNYFLAGAQDNGTHQLNGAGLTSSVEVTGGDGAFVDIDMDQPQYQYGAYIYNQYRRSTNGGTNWSSVNFSGSIGEFINPFDYDDAGNKMYCCYNANQYLRWDDPQTGSTFTPITMSNFNGGKAEAITVSPFTANRVFFGTSTARIVRVDNANTATPTETNITPAALTGFVNGIALGSTEQNIIATVTTATAGTTNVWVTSDGGTTWTACDGNLPDLPVYSAVFHPDNNGKAFISTEAGVWYTDALNGASTVWVPETTFPTVKTEMLRYRSSDRTLAAATHGRGLWTATIPSGCTVTATITSQPANSTVCPATNTSFSVTGTAISFQWQVSIDGGTTWSNVSNGGVYSGATTTTLTLTGVTAVLNNNKYRCVATGDCVPTTVNSNAATLTVSSLANITSQPASSAICAGLNTTFSVSASGTSLTYQWQESTNGGTTWNNITNGGVYSGATTNTLTLTGVTAGMTTYQYRCAVTSGCSAIPVNSNGATLTVNAATNITGQPAASTICAGLNTSFTVTATGASLTYQWQVSTDGGVTYNNITNGGVYSNVTAATMNITGATAIMNNNRYRCVVSSACSPLNSNAVILTVNSAAAVTAQPANTSICAGNATSFSVTATGSSITYQWQESTNGGTTWNNVANGGVYSGTTTNTLSLTAVPIGMNTYQYRCIVTSALCSPAATSAAGILTVGSTLVINSQPTNNIVCTGANAVYTINVSGTVTYQWQESTNGGTTWTNITNGGIYSGATSSTLTLTAVLASMNNYLYRCTVSGNCPSINSNNASLTVNTAPAITSQPAAAVTICSGQNTSFTTAASGTAVTYQWQVSTDGGVTYTNLANGGVYSNVTTATMNITAATATMNNYRYRCVASGTCTPSANTSAAVLTVNTAVAVSTNPVNSLVCENGSTSFSVAATGTTPSYQWQLSTDGGTTYNNVTNGGVYSGATTTTLTLTGITASLNNNRYRCVVGGATSCASVNSGAGILSVNAAPAGFAVTGGGAYCAGGTGVPVGINSSTTGISYQLLLNGVNTGTAVAGTGTAISFGNKTVAGTYTVVATNITTGCSVQMPGSVAVSINPLPLVSIAASPYQRVYPGLSTTITATVTTTANPVTYAWFKNNVSISNTGNTVSVNITNMGDYRVIATDANGCSSQSSVITIADSANNKLFIYPSPNDGRFNVVYYNSGNTTVVRTLAIFSSKGEKVYYNKFTINQPYQVIQIDLRRSGAGVYYVVLGDANNVKLKTGEVLVR